MVASKLPPLRAPAGRLRWGLELLPLERRAGSGAETEAAGWDSLDTSAPVITTFHHRDHHGIMAATTLPPPNFNFFFLSQLYCGRRFWER